MSLRSLPQCHLRSPTPGSRAPPLIRTTDAEVTTAVERWLKLELVVAAAVASVGAVVQAWSQC